MFLSIFNIKMFKISALIANHKPIVTSAHNKLKN
jgi:hypothetical protein